MDENTNIYISDSPGGNFFQKIKEALMSRHLLSIIAILFIALAIPGTIFLTQQIQDIRQHASTNGSITFIDSSTNAAITQTTTENIKLKIALPDNVAISTPSSRINFEIPKVYAQDATPSATAFPTPTSQTPVSDAPFTPTPTTSEVFPPTPTESVPTATPTTTEVFPPTATPTTSIEVSPTPIQITNTPAPSPTPTTPPAFSIIQIITIHNTDSGSGGHEPETLNTKQIIDALNNGIDWMLNPLASKEDSATRTVTVDFTVSDSSGSHVITTSADITLARNTSGTPSPGISPTPPNSSGFITTIINNHASYYSTYQSHDRKMVANQNGIFMTYITNTVNQDTNNENSTWKLMQSTDGGTSFTTAYSVDNAHSRAPVIETDSDGNLYIVEANWADTTKAHFYKFASSNNYRSPIITTEVSLGTISAKYAMEIDEARQQLYFLTNPGLFTILGFDGKIKSQFKLTNVVNPNDGDTFRLHYPLLFLDKQSGFLYAAWTTTNDTANVYWSISFVRSRDGGTTFEKPTGLAKGDPIATPLDPTNPKLSVTITPSDELAVNTWLESFLVKNGKVHFMYKARDPLNRMHYVRYDLASAQIDKNISPEFKGDSIVFGTSQNPGDEDYDGFLVSGSGDSIYAVNRNVNPPGPYAIGILKSDDNGTTWHDLALGPTPQEPIYALGGDPYVSPSGNIIGAFTQSTNGEFTNPDVTKVVFFSVSSSYKMPIFSPTSVPSAAPSENPLSPTPTTTEISPVPTKTLSPTPTITAGDDVFSLSIPLSGIGDKTGNSSPVNQQRKFTVGLYDANNKEVQHNVGILTFDTTTKKFSGDMDMGVITPGTYTAKAATAKYLTKTIANIVNITSDTKTYTISAPTAMVAGDLNGDNQIDIQDYNIYKDCFNKQTPECISAADLNDDGQIDRLDPTPNFLDYRLLIQNFNTRQGD